MSSAKVMFSFPDHLVTRMRASIPQRERSRVLAKLLEKELDAREEALYQAAKEVEACGALRQEMAEWDAAFSADGLEDLDK